ncbi:MAG: hypothetical protein ACXW38_09130, partial [Nitrospira sp.]
GRWWTEWRSSFAGQPTNKQLTDRQRARSPTDGRRCQEIGSLTNGPKAEAFQPGSIKMTFSLRPGHQAIQLLNWLVLGSWNSHPVNQRPLVGRGGSCRTH